MRRLIAAAFVLLPALVWAGLVNVEGGRQAGATGEVSFVTTTYTRNEGTNVSIAVQRTGGSYGTCNVGVFEEFGGDKGTLNTPLVHFGNTDAANKTVSLDLGDVTVDSTMTIVLANAAGSGCTVGEDSTAEINITYVPTGGAGTYGFLGSQTVSNNESTTFLRCASTRQDGSSGAVSVQIVDTTVGDGVSGGACDTPADYTISNDPLTNTFANGISGDNANALNFTANNVSADCAVTCGFASPTGGWTLTSTGNQTKTVNIVNVGGGGCTLTNYYPWSSGTFADMGLAISGNSPTLVTSPQREPGSKSVRAYINRTEAMPFRTELEGVGTRPPWRTITRYGFSIYIPTGYSQSSFYNGPFIQLHAEPLDWNELDVMQSPDWYLTIADNNAAVGDRGKWYVESNRAHVAEGMGQAASEVSSRIYFGNAGLGDKTGKWWSFALEVVPDWRRPEDGGIGYWRLYIKNDDNTHTLVASIADGTGFGANTTLAHNLYLKEGIYKRSWEGNPADIIVDRWVYHGPMRIGNSSCSLLDVSPVGANPIQTVNWIMPAFLFWSRRRRAANDDRYRKAA